jgi:hypothetical protein
MDGAILMFLWMSGTTAIALTALLIGCLAVIRSRSRPAKSLVNAMISFTVALVAVLANPIVNWRLFHHERDSVVASMLAHVGTPSTAITAKYGKPHSIVTDADFETWRYWPGPRYMLLRWEEVLFRMQGGRVVAAFVDD